MGRWDITAKIYSFHLETQFYYRNIIGVHQSTISREVKRNSNQDGKYVFTVAQTKCESRKHSTLGNHRKDAILWWRVEQMIKDEDWSPRQICGVLAKEGIHIYPQAKTAQADQSHQHSQPDKHTRATASSQRQKVWRLGDGSDCGRATARDTYVGGTQHEYASDGENENISVMCSTS